MKLGVHKRSANEANQRNASSSKSQRLLRPHAPSLCTTPSSHQTQQPRHISHGQRSPPHNTGSGCAGSRRQGRKGKQQAAPTNARVFFFTSSAGSHEGQDQKVRLVRGPALPSAVGRKRQRMGLRRAGNRGKRVPVSPSPLAPPVHPD